MLIITNGVYRLIALRFIYIVDIQPAVPIALFLFKHLASFFKQTIESCCKNYLQPIIDLKKH